MSDGQPPAVQRGPPGFVPVRNSSPANACGRAPARRDPSIHRKYGDSRCLTWKLAGAPVLCVGTGVLVHNAGLSCKVKIDRNDLSGPPSKREMSYWEDGYPVELHHVDQAGNEVKENDSTDHRLGDNFANNHSNTGSAASKIDRSEFGQRQEAYWSDEWDKGSFDGF